MGKAPIRYELSVRPSGERSHLGVGAGGTGDVASFGFWHWRGS